MTDPTRLPPSNPPIRPLYGSAGSPIISLDSSDLRATPLLLPASSESTPHGSISLSSGLKSAVELFVFERDETAVAKDKTPVSTQTEPNKGAARLVERRYLVCDGDDGSAAGSSPVSTDATLEARSEPKPYPPLEHDGRAKPLETRAPVTLVVYWQDASEPATVDMRFGRGASNSPDDDFAVRNGSLIEFDIDPGEPGMVSVALQVTGKRINVSMSAQQPDLVRDLRSSMPELGRLLSDVDYPMNSVVIRDSLNPL